MMWAGVAAAQKAETEKAVKFIQAGDIDGLATLFAADMDLIVLEEYDQITSKAQAQQILKNFFKSHEPKSMKIIHEGVTTMETYYRIGELETANGKFTVRFSLKKMGENILIHQFRIEKE